MTLNTSTAGPLEPVQILGRIIPKTLLLHLIRKRWSPCSVLEGQSMRFLWGLESPAPNRHWGCFSCFTCNQTLMAPERRHLTLKSPLIGSFSWHTLGKTGTRRSQRLVVHVVPCRGFRALNFVWTSALSRLLFCSSLGGGITCTAK